MRENPEDKKIFDIQMILTFVITLVFYFILQLVSNIGIRIYSLQDFYSLLLMCVPLISSYLVFKYLKNSKIVKTLLFLSPIVFGLIAMKLLSTPTNVEARFIGYVILTSAFIWIGKKTFEKGIKENERI